MDDEPIERLERSWGGRRIGAPDPRRVAGLSFVLVLLAGLFLHRGSVLYDTDSYFHLAVARAYAREGLIEDLRWTRFSAMHRGFGDKEILFHGLLAPFAARDDPGAGAPLRGGRWALSLLGALAAATVAAAATRSIGWWAALLPPALAVGSTELAWRAVRLRPELLALSLLVAVLYCLGTGRYRWAGLGSFLFTLAYTAWHALAGLVTIVFLYRVLIRRGAPLRAPTDWPWQMLLLPWLGIGLGLVAHPHFPHNLEIWVLQTFEFFRLKATLDVGSEIRPNFTDVTLMVNLGWLLGLVALWRSSTPASRSEIAGSEVAVLDAAEREEAAGRLADTFGVAAAVFVVLYLLMSRFSLYAVTLVTLWLLFELERRGRRIGGRTRLPGGRTISLAVALVLCLSVSLPEAVRQIGIYRQRVADQAAERLADRRARASLLPAGARVAADWGDTATLMLWAPQARYLNALDPAFMAVPNPGVHRTLRGVLDGEEPDVPLATVAVLESDYLVVPRTAGYPRLTARLAADPRAKLLQRGSQDLYRLQPAPPGHFVVDWWLPAGGSPPGGGSLPDARQPSYPLSRGALRAYEGFVDGARVPAADAAGCRRFVRALAASGAASETLHLAPAGPTRLWVDGELVLAVASDLGAIPGGGVTFTAPPATVDRRLEVETCPAADGRVGFYFAAGSASTAADLAVGAPRSAGTGGTTAAARRTGP